ncbi:hypothetical protein [Nitrobacter hamburgensis]|uniref:hypothetical protein n=1 Tax=Nitrobacter hamburgensis TaxID=912 RepID=UPI001FD9940E|nr:hypothetical protein [Nitrobacter hamburgensis]
MREENALNQKLARIPIAKPVSTFAERALDHDDFGANRSKIMIVIDPNILERDAGGKPLRTFPHSALVVRL